MSTRGAVGWRTKVDGWEGVYNHCDSYPTGLGAEVWKILKEVGAKRLVGALQNMDDWRQYESCGICEYCGKVTGQPHSISGVICGNNEVLDPKYPEVFENMKRFGFPDPKAKYHKHNEGGPEKNRIKSNNADPLFIEWVYIIDDVLNMLTVYEHQHDPNYKDNQPVAKKVKVRKDGFVDYGHCAYRHVKVDDFDLSGPEPDWAKMENGNEAPEVF